MSWVRYRSGIAFGNSARYDGFGPMQFHGIVLTLATGTALLVFGLMPIPAFFKLLAESFRAELESLFWRTPMLPRRRMETDMSQMQLWLAGFGALLVVSAFVAYAVD